MFGNSLAQNVLPQLHRSILSVTCAFVLRVLNQVAYFVQGGSGELLGKRSH